MARIECYVSDELKEKIATMAESKSTSVSKLITQILENHFSGNDNQIVFQKKVLAMLCEIYGSVYDTNLPKEKRDAAIQHMRDISTHCDEALSTSVC